MKNTNSVSPMAWVKKHAAQLAAFSGLAMAFAPQFGLIHGDTVATALLVHHFSVWLAAAGLPIHIYMAALVREERPALHSMICGTISVRASTMFLTISGRAAQIVVMIVGSSWIIEVSRVIPA